MNYELIAPRSLSYSAIEQVLRNRGIEDIEHYLNTSDSDILNPLTIDNVVEGAKMLVSHIARGSKVMIQIDSDADGYTSAAALINYLNHLVPSFVQNNISYRPHTGKMHGLILDTIPDDVGLVIAPDSSSNDYEVHQALRERGIDVLVIDHHEAEKVSEYACVINNQLCDYPTKSLSGVGMVYKFCSYLDSLLGVNHANEILDLVALGLVADMVSLKDYETKHLIHLGLRQINNPFFKGMTIKNEFSLGSNITPFGVAFYVAPYINAVTRVGTPDEKITMFEAMLDFKAFEMIPSTKRGYKGSFETRVEQACRNCVNIKNRQTKTRDASLEIIEQIIAEQNLVDDKVLLVTLNKNQKSSLSGLIANQLMSIYQRPVFILNETDHEGQTWWEGSGRGPNVPGLEDCRDFCETSGLVEYSEGHANAFGIGITNENLQKFKDYCNEHLKDFDFTPTYKVDFEYKANELKNNFTDFYNLIEYSHLWGQEVEQPFIAITNIPITRDSITLMKGTTLKISVSDCPDISFIKFRSSEQEFEVLCPDSDLGCVNISVIGVCERNSYNDKPQIIVKDYCIEKRQQYYF